MARLEHLLSDEPRPSNYKLTLDADYRKYLADAMANAAAERIKPFIEALFNAQRDEGRKISESSTAHKKAVQETRKALEQAIAAESKAIQDVVKEAASAAQKATLKDSRAMRDGLVAAMGRVVIPDHAEQLGRIEAAQKAVVEGLKNIPKPEPRPTEWDFDVNRNRNGFIQSVTAKAK